MYRGIFERHQKDIFEVIVPELVGLIVAHSIQMNFGGIPL